MNSIDLTVKTTLAKLLAKENIQVLVGNYSTAMFDVKNRRMFLPKWNEMMEKSVADLLISHEVGHALYTPLDETVEALKEVPKVLINIFEDIRIERLIQETYPGLSRTYAEGYASLLAKDFFRFGPTPDFSSMTPGDRINIFAKCGFLLGGALTLTEKEQSFYSRAYSASSFSEIVEISKEFGEYLKEEKEKEKQEQSSGDDTLETPDDTPEEENTESPEASTDSGESEEENKSEEDGGESEAPHNDDVSSETPQEKKETVSSGTEEIKTASALEDFSAQNVENNLGVEILYVPATLDKHFISYEELKKARKEIKNTCNRGDGRDWVDFKKSSGRAVSLLVSEFNRKKAATEYSRSEEARTGSLDMKKLFSYKTSEDLFLRNTILKQGQNHGMILLVDNSSSMEYVYHGVIKQTIQLCMFCRSVDIPFKVFTFTNNYGATTKAYGPDYVHNPSDISMRNLVLVELLNSDMSKGEFEIASEATFHASKTFGFKSNFEVMSGTPLLEALIAVGSYIPNFKNKFGVEKMNLVVLSDGDGNYIMSNGKIIRKAKVAFELNGATVSGTDYESLYGGIIKNISERTGTNVIGYYLTLTKSLPVKKIYYSTVKLINEYLEKQKAFRKDEIVEFSNVGGYSKYYVMKASETGSSDDFKIGSVPTNDGKTKSGYTSKIADALLSAGASFKRGRTFAIKFSSAIS